MFGILVALNILLELFLHKLLVQHLYLLETTAMLQRSRILKTNISPKRKLASTFMSEAKNWSPTIYTVASEEIENTIIPSASYRVYRVIDGYNAIPHGTGSDLQTLLSYDVSGNYFNLDMSLLEPGYVNTESNLRFTIHSAKLGLSKTRSSYSE